ncbi:MAG: ATP-binding cassette domain-containing protein [Mycoplasmoidaceae bacterium]|nr:ATP-binding cassette domain-containing protein [Mycoplasmoidaceae bacterium]
MSRRDQVKNSKVKNIVNKAHDIAVSTNKRDQYVGKICLDNLKIVFDEKTPDETVVLNETSYEFNKNKIYFIIGNSGSGKTTLLTHFNGLLKSKDGNILIDRLSILGKKKKIKDIKKLRKKVGMVFQFPEYQLFKDTIEKDVMFGPINLGVPKAEAKKRAKYYLELLGLNESFLERSPFNLSGGQKRRVALAGILSIEPEIIIFDEPTAGLDPTGEQDMMKIITNLKQSGKTIFVITHVMDQVLSIGDEVLVIGDKKILAAGKPYNIFTNDELIRDNFLDRPKVIKVIYELIKMDKKYKSLLEVQPRNVSELADAIVDIMDGGKHE